MRFVRYVVYNEKAIEWQDVPGYKATLKALLEEMKYRDISTYTEALIESVRSFCSNPRVLNVVIHISFSKTNKFNSTAVWRTMKMSQRWFLKLQQKDLSIPSDFNWPFFMKGVNMLLSMDHSTSTSSVIWLLYQILHVIPSDIRKNLINSMVTSENFYRFFFHWSWNVRRSFYYFFYFQLHRILIDNKVAAHDMA